MFFSVPIFSRKDLNTWWKYIQKEHTPVNKYIQKEECSWRTKFFAFFAVTPWHRYKWKACNLFSFLFLFSSVHINSSFTQDCRSWSQTCINRLRWYSRWAITSCVWNWSQTSPNWQRHNLLTVPTLGLSCVCYSSFCFSPQYSIIGHYNKKRRSRYTQNW